MKVFNEVTDWAVPNHTYILSDDKSKMYAYVKRNTKTVTEFKKPYRFDSKGRKFVEVPNTYGYVKPEAVPEGFVKIVLGSKGDKYTITEVDGVRQCTCSGFKFRGSCKHVTS